MAAPLWERWDEVAPRLARGTLLAGFDYDGTLVGIRPSPEEVRTDEATRQALAELAAIPGTAVAVVSGRPVAQLRALLPAAALWLVGLHGLELAAPHGEVLPTRDLDAAAAMLAPLLVVAEAIAARHPGVRVEDKGATLVLHTRQASRADAAAAAAAFRSAVAGGAGFVLDGFELLAGKEVLEVRPAGEHKGTALTRLHREAGGQQVLYVGDDLTDEDAFGTLGAGAVTVRVVSTYQSEPAVAGTRAAYTLADPAEVGELLQRLIALRRH
ncbi:MAG TPA: trehalose-phosphatase [Thermoanaerobaculia bacterium]|nr:trehalose-phosphatase [Thermoanaerobaculia bacterium]